MLLSLYRNTLPALHLSSTRISLLVPIRPCPALRKYRSSIVLTLQRSHTICTSRKRSISSEFLSIQSYMVRAGHLHLYACLPVLLFSDQSLLGFLVVLFFRCMAALFDPIHRRGERTNWWLVSYTVFMFLAATAQTAMAFYLRMSSYVDNRGFPGFESTTPPRPLGYESLSFKDALVIVDDVTNVLLGYLVSRRPFGKHSVHFCVHSCC